jgi:hypothetical protein
MTWTRMTMATALVLTVGSVGSGIVLHAMSAGPEVPKSGLAPARAAQFEPGQSKEAGGKDAVAAARDKSSKNLMVIGLAMHNFADRQSNGENRFPPAAIRKDGKPRLSWRVAILPFLDRADLYHKFHLDEPWDSRHNKTLLNQMPEVYAPVVRTNAPPGSTYYQVFTGPGALFEDDHGPKLAEINDGLPNTILVAEAGSPVPWTKPEDIPFDKDKPVPKLSRLFEDGICVAFADGSTRFLPKDIEPAALHALITSSAGDFVNFEKF